MKVLPPKVTRAADGTLQNSWPDDAPEKVIAVTFDGTNFTFYEPGDELPPPADG